MRTKSKELIEATKEYLRAPDDPDIGLIPTTIPDKTDAVLNLSEYDLEKLTNTFTFYPLQEEFLGLHEWFWHLPIIVMFRFVKMGFLPPNFWKLTNKAPQCVSCLLGQAHRKLWHFKKTNYGNISTFRGKNLSKPGDTIGVD